MSAGALLDGPAPRRAARARLGAAAEIGRAHV